MKFLHLVLDEKFIDGICDVIDKVAVGEHEFAYFNQFHQPIRYLSEKCQKKVEIHTSRKSFRKRILACNYDILFIHSLKAVDLKILPMLPPAVKVWWSSWGYDIYSNSGMWKRTHDLIPCQFYAPRTIQIIKSQVWTPKSVINKIISVLAFLIFAPERFFLSQKEFEKAIARIDYCSTVLQPEFVELKKNSFLKAKYLTWVVSSSQNPYEEDVADNSDNHHNILVGNAAARSMNHSDVFHMLKGKLSEDRKIIVPLSYGDAGYAKIIEKEGREIWHDNFVALKTFLPMNEYLKILKTCSCAIFYSFRQQAMGNINLMLYLGCKVFLPVDSCAFQFYRNMGIKIFSLEDITEKMLNTQLSEEDKRMNRILIRNNRGMDFTVKKFRESYNIIMKDVL